MNANEATLIWADEYSRMAETYDRFVVPRFEPVAKAVAEFASPAPGELFLDFGTGTGLLARLIAPRILPQSVVAIDLADNALSVGSYRSGEAGIRNIRFEMMDSRNIVYPGRLFNGVVSNFGVPNLGYDRTFAETYRVLKPSGRFVFSEWDAEVPPGAVLVSSLLEKYGTATPSKDLAAVREARNFSQSAEECRAKGDPRSVKDALRSAGFEHVSVVTKTFDVRFDSVADMMAFEASWGRVDRELSELTPSSRRAFDEELRDRLRLRAKDGPIQETWTVHFYAARP